MLFKLFEPFCQLRSLSNHSVSIVGKQENGNNRIAELLHVVVVSDDRQQATTAFLQYEVL